MDLYKFLIGIGVILLSLILILYQKHNGAFSGKEKLTQNDVRLFFAIVLGLAFGLYYLVSAF
ncbi:hypothetical protein [Peijinzhouia sedimentorum]